MNTKNAVIALSTALAFSATAALAQGRHDEKPHGKPAKTEKKEKKAEAMQHRSGGRHDEKPHGKMEIKGAKKQEKAEEKK